MAEIHLHDVARQISRLIGCSAVYVFLGCQEAELRHPLLNSAALSRYRSVDCPSSSAGSVLLKDERVRALYDLAMQSGHIQWLDYMRPFPTDSDLVSLVIAPLERPAGVLGFVLLAGSRAEAFDYGERLLLSQYLPQVAQQLEQELSDVNIVPPDHQVISAAEESVEQRTSTHTQVVDQLQQEAQPVPEYAQLQRQLKELDQLKNEFISMVSHELRTPLSAIKGYAVLLKAYGLTDNAGESGTAEMSLTRQREYVDSIMEQANHLEVLISDLLDISRIQAGRISLRNSEVNIVPLCQRVVRLVQQKADQEYPGRYKIACNLPADLPCIWADADRLRQILTNLLENAVKYSPSGGLIEVLASTCVPQAASSVGDVAASDSDGIVESQMYISVRDQGIGIAQEQLSLLFRPFVRLEHPSTVDIPGAGLGLYISRKLVEAMGGEMSLSSNPGVGTSVTFTVPIQASHIRPQPARIPITGLLLKGGA